MEKEECMITLDEIVNIVLTGGESGGEDPPFVRMCEKKVTREVLAYTDKIARKGAEGKEEGGEEKDTWMEDEAGALMDAVCGANRVYFKMGMKLGAGLVSQLLNM